MHNVLSYFLLPFVLVLHLTKTRKSPDAIVWVWAFVSAMTWYVIAFGITVFL